MCRAKIRKKKKTSTPVPTVLLHNAGSKVHGHNVMRHFLELLSMLSDLDLAYLLINPIGTSMCKCIYVLVLKWVHLSF